MTKDEPASARPLAEAVPVRLEPAEFADLYSAHCSFVYYLALRLLGDAAQAEDAAHEVFLKAYRHLDQFRFKAKVRTWLYRITINHCRSWLRKWEHQHVLTAPEPIALETAASPADSPLRVLEIKELGQCIQKTLDALSPEYRLLLLLAADEQLSYAEIAELTGQSVDAVRGKLHRARRAFIAQFRRTT
ncbi:MAG: RNA polymerase sigma factor [Candidatus Omnitrophica bacterium]|nr:RNA polymerase sigma factor [Candidatus Omnitrophota bacterium]